MDAETGFIIDGTRYEVPTLDTFTMDEAQVLYDYCGLTIEDFVPLAAESDEERDLTADAADELDKKLKNPGFLRALLHVAYQRANPNLSASRVKATIGGADLVQNFAALIGGDEDDAGPPASTTEPEKSSPNDSAGSNASSGSASETSSDEQDSPPEPITTTGSDTSLASALTSSAA